jgi:hypothetical protein
MRPYRENLFMPYIKNENRQKIDNGTQPENPGELNYTIFKILQKYLEMKGTRYETLNDIMGVLNCLTQEFYRRIASPYEDEKIQENGDIM